MDEPVLLEIVPADEAAVVQPAKKNDPKKETASY